MFVVSFNGREFGRAPSLEQAMELARIEECTRLCVSPYRSTSDGLQPVDAISWGPEYADGLELSATSWVGGWWRIDLVPDPEPTP
jgi:hypothetical protein